AVDISEDEIRHNRDVDEARVANIMQELPFGPNEADLIVSRSVLEHLTDLEAFVRASANVIKPGGHFIHLFPNRSAPFALINRMLPNAASRRLVHFLHPETVGICGFPAFYDHCSAEAITRLLEKHGFVIEELRVSYYQSGYFTFFVPAYLVSAAYEMVLHSLDARSLAAYVMVVARKK